VRILFDQGTPVPLRRSLAPHEVSTAFEMGWSKLENGELLAAAEGQFDLLLTTDQISAINRTLPADALRSWSCRPQTGWRFASTNQKSRSP
jgi:hypothetical protein